MRVEPVIAVPAADGVGPTRLRLLTARSAKLPVVIVVEAADGTPGYHVFDVASLQSALTNQLSATQMAQALDLAERASASPIARADVAAAGVGLPVVENGRLIGVTADDVPEHPEPTEQDMNRGASSAGSPVSGSKRSLWQRLSGSKS